MLRGHDRCPVGFRSSLSTRGTCDNERLFVARYCRFRCHTSIENAQELVTRSGLSRRRRNQPRTRLQYYRTTACGTGLIRAPGRASVDRPSSRAVLWAGGNRWKSRGAQRAKANGCSDKHRQRAASIRIVANAPRTAGAILRSAATSKTSNTGEGQS